MAFFFGFYFHRPYEYHKTTIVEEAVDKNDSLDMHRKVVWFYSFNSIISSHRTDCHGTNNWTRIPKWFTINIKKLLACTQEWNSSNMWVMKAYQNTYYNLWFGIIQLGRHILISPCYLLCILEFSFHHRNVTMRYSFYS
jgi:hypothetical protein